MSAMFNFNRLVVESLSFGDGGFSGNFLVGSEVECKLRLGSIGLFGLEFGFGNVDNSEGVGYSCVCSYLLVLDLFEVVDDSDVAVRDAEDVVA